MNGSNRQREALLFFSVLLSSFLPRAAHGGDLATFPTPTASDNITSISVRQKVCDRYKMATNNDGEFELKNALSGMTIHPILTYSEFFNYNETTGIDEFNPGIAVRILDELASEKRANFTWRNSFAVSTGPEANQTWTQMLQLYTEVFDVSIDYWDKNSERLNKGIAFMEQWFNGNMILIEKIKPVTKDTSVNYLNFMAPFTYDVWFVTLMTVIVSAVIYQWLEWMNNERDDRSFYKWFEDNLYLSSLNFTQQYMYEPSSGAGRIFSFSMAIWAMVMGATYTANLASLFVEELGEPSKIQDIDEALRKGYKICVWKGTNADAYIGKRYPQAMRVRMPTEFETYQGLHTGKCQVAIGAESTWLGFEKDRDYNPQCDLEWVGKTVEQVSSAFAVRADPADKCTNLIRDVLNYHLSEMAVEGVLSEFWEEYYSSNDRAIDCATYEPGDEELEFEEGVDETQDSLTRRLLSPFTSNENQPQSRRELKGGGGGASPAAAANGGGDDEGSSLSMTAMAGTFVLHAALSALSILVGIFSWHRKKSRGDEDGSNQDSTFPINDLHMKENYVAGASLASGTANRDYGVKNMLVQSGTVDEKLQALFESHKDMHRNQEQMAQQMELVVSMLTRMQEHEQFSTTKTEVSKGSSVGSYFFGS